MRVEVSPSHAVARGRQPLVFKVQVTNTGDIISGHVVRVLGVDPAWVTLSSGRVSLFPGQTETITVTLDLPVGLPAGDRRVAIQLRELTPPHRASLVDVVVSVPTSHAVTLRLDPTTVTGGARANFGLVAVNRGNTRITGALTGNDPEERLKFRFTPHDLRLDPGEHTAVTLTVRGRRKLTGNPRPRPFSVGLEDPAATPIDPKAEGVSPARGTLVQRPVLTRGAFALAGLLAAITVFALVIVYAFSTLASNSAEDSNLALQVAQANAISANGTSGVGGTVRLLTTGAPVDGVTVEVFQASNVATPVATTATNAAGAYSLTGLASGSYKLDFKGASFAELWYPSALTPSDAGTVNVQTGQVLNTLDVRLGGLPATLSGTVVTTTNGDVTGATVSLELPGASAVPTVATASGRSAATTTDAGALVESTQVGSGGAFSLANIPSPSVYDLAVSKPGYATEVEPIDLGGGETRTGVQIVLQLGNGIIAGQVSTTTGPVGGASITATYQQTSVQTVSVTQGRVGSFTLRNLPTPATFTIVVSAPGLASQTLTLSLGSAQELTGVDVVLAGASGSLSGQVDEFPDTPVGSPQPAAEPAGGVTVVISNGTLTVSTVTESRGQIGSWTVAGLPIPSTYAITFSRPDLGSQTVSVSLSAYGVATATGNEGASSASGSLVTTTLRSATAEIEGVVSEGGVPTGELTVHVSSGTTSYSVFTASVPQGELGAYEIDGLLPGTYTVSVSGPGTLPSSGIYTLAAGSVQVNSPNLAIPAGVEVSVLAANGQPLPGAQVVLYLASSYPTTPLATGTTGSAGYYKFADVAAPNFYVVQAAYPPGGTPIASQTFELKQSTTAQITLRDTSSGPTGGGSPTPQSSTGSPTPTQPGEAAGP